MKKAISIAGGVLGFLAGIIVYILVMELVFESERFSTKLGGLAAIAGAIGGASLAERLTRGRPGRSGEPGPSASSQEDKVRQQRLWEAVVRNDPEELEGLRDVIRPVDVAPLASHWGASLDWPTKEALISLLTDRTADKHPEIEPILRDGLSAPSFEVRCYAYCSLTGDFDGFTAIVQGGHAALNEQLRARGLA